MGHIMIGDILVQLAFALIVILIIVSLTKFFMGRGKKNHSNTKMLEERTAKLEEEVKKLKKGQE